MVADSGTQFDDEKQNGVELEMSDIAIEANSFTEKNGLSTGPLPVDLYVSKEMFELERDRIFKKAWLLVAREDEVASPGDYMLREIEVAKASIVICRQKDGSVRTFHNVCPHRGNRVVDKESGHATRFVCGYHMWTFKNDGQLIGVPDEKNFFSFDKQKCGLVEIATEVWNGWVFVNLAREPEIGLKEFLGDLDGFMDGIEYPTGFDQVRISTELDCNWKTASDAFSETYHVPAIHPRTIGETFASKQNPFAHLLDVQTFGPHRFASLYGNPDYELDNGQIVEALSFAVDDSGGKTPFGFTPSKNKADNVGKQQADASQIDKLLSHSSINPTRSNGWAMDILHVFPNTHLSAGAGGFWYLQFWPRTESTCFYEGRFYMPRAQSAAVRLQQEIYIARVVEIWLEDLQNVAKVQKGLESGAISEMHLQDSEALLRHGVEQVLKWTSSETAAEALEGAN